MRKPFDSTRNFDQSRVSMPAVYTATTRRIPLKCNQSAGHTCVGVLPAQGQGGHWRDEEMQLGERDQVGRDLVQVDVRCQNHRGNRERKPTITERKWKYIEIVSGRFLATTLKICRANDLQRRFQDPTWETLCILLHRRSLVYKCNIDEHWLLLTCYTIFHVQQYRWWWWWWTWSEAGSVFWKFALFGRFASFSPHIFLPAKYVTNWLTLKKHGFKKERNKEIYEQGSNVCSWSFLLKMLFDRRKTQTEILK